MSSFNLASMLGLKNTCNNPSLSCLFEKYTDNFPKTFGPSGKLHSMDEKQLDKILNILYLCNIYEKNVTTSGVTFQTEKEKKIYIIQQYYKNPDKIDVEFLANDFKNNSAMAGSPIHDSEQRPTMFKCNENFQASKKAIEAYSTTNLYFSDDLDSINVNQLDNILKISSESLKISPNCIEAFNILGLFKSNNYEEALKYFREGQEKKSEYYHPSNLKLNEKNNWTKHELRQYFRSIIGEANILRKMGKYAEALDAYNRAMKLDPEIHASMVSYCNFQYNIPECLMKLGRWKEAYDFMKKNKDLLSLSSSKVLLWSFALCDFMIKKKSTKDNSVEEHVEYIESGRERDSELYGPIAVAALNSPYVYEYLLGIRKLANIRIPNALAFSNNESSICSQAQYISDHLDLWLSNPDALEWAIKNANIINCHLTLNNEEKKLERKYMDRSKPFDNFFKLYTKLYFPDARAEPNIYLLHAAVRAKNLDAVKLLVDQGATIYTKTEPTPFHFACYYDYGANIVKYFCEKTGTPLKIVKLQQSPLVMSLNQGNWKPLVEILSYLLKKKTLTNDILQNCLKELFNTSVYECVKGKEKCQRCYMTNVPHSNDVSFEKCVDAIILFGLKITKKLLYTFRTDQHLKKSLMQYIESRLDGSVSILPISLNINDKEILELLEIQNSKSNISNTTNNDTSFPEETPEELKNKGNEEFKRGASMKALEYYNKALKHSDCLANIKPILHSNMSACYFNLKNYERALASANESILIDENFSKGYYRKAVALENLDRINEAIQICELVMKKDPNNDLIINLLKKLNPNHIENNVSEQSYLKTDYGITTPIENSTSETTQTERKNYNCMNCGKPNSKKKCGACQSVVYCSKECQAKHWKTHKITCNK